MGISNGLKISNGLGINISSRLKTKGVQIATIVFLIISVVLIWQIINAYPEIGILRDKIKTQEMITEDSEDTLKRLKELISFTAKNKEIINKFDLVLPADEDKANLLSNLDSLASASGLSTLKIVFEESSNPAGEKQGAAGALPKNYDFDSRTVKMSLRGSYLSFKNFLAAIEKNQRVMDIVFVDFSSDSSSKEIEGERKTYSYNIELKTYLHNPLKEQNIAKLLSSAKFKNFTAKNLNFINEKVFGGLFLSPDYNINTGVDEIGNQDIF
ncbi:type 4a pilus biogenesis protein PilO [Patescibacteria group bacterium]|nr:type 4a pilus biogenesis protein PilO [Patescibacteria group bacterium]